MTTKFMNSIKSVFVICFALFSVIACEKDFESVGVTLVDNNLFDTKDSVFEVIAYNKDIVSSRVDLLPQYLIGVYNDPNFGLIKASFVSQVGIPIPTDFNTNAKIDSVILDIPYYATDTSSVTTSRNFRLDSILSNAVDEFTLSVYESGTFLNALDPVDPTQAKRYFSDEDYIKKTLLYTGSFKPNRNDTVLFIKRDFLFPDKDTLVIDTILKDPVSPSIKLPLSETFFKSNFIDQQNSGAFSSLENFINYFRGIIIEADGSEGSLMTLAMNNASINIYYTSDILTNETENDLNGDGDTDDTNVPVTTKQTMLLPLSGIRTGTYDRDYTTATSDIVTSLISPNKVDGDDKLYIQGAAGSIAEVELFKEVNLEDIRDQNWLINGAFLDIYVDNPDDKNIPNQLFLYNIDNNSVIRDLITEGQVNGIGGFLQRDDDGKPYRYQFSITDYISEVLKSDNLAAVNKLAIKTYHPTDAPQSLTDTIVRDFSWNPKGVVIKGVRNDSDTDYSERIQLNIFYTQENN